MNLLNWPSRKNLKKAALALRQMERDNVILLTPAKLAMYMDIRQSEARFILEAAERTSSVESLYKVTCPNCNSPYNTYKFKDEIPEYTDICDSCDMEHLKINERNIQKVYKINE